MDRCAEAEEAEDIREQILLTLEWVAMRRGGEQLRWIVAPGTGEDNRKEALERARRLTEEARKYGLEVEDDHAEERPSRWRGMGRGRGGQMRFTVEDRDSGEERDEREQDQARGEEGREPGQAASGKERKRGGRRRGGRGRCGERRAGECCWGHGGREEQWGGDKRG